MVFGLEREAPLGQQARELARFLVVARPFERAPALGELGLILLVGVALAARAERAQRELGALAAVDPRRSEEDDRVLDFLLLESAQRLEVLREDPDRPRLGALEELTIQIRERLLRHKSQCIMAHARDQPPYPRRVRSAAVVDPVDLRRLRSAIDFFTSGGVVPGGARDSREADSTSRRPQCDGDLRQ